MTGSIDGVPDIYKAMIDGEANASVELTPNMAGPAFDALEKYKKDGTMPEKLTLTKSTLYLPDTAKEEFREEKYGYWLLCLMPIRRPDKALAPHPAVVR